MKKLIKEVNNMISSTITIFEQPTSYNNNLELIEFPKMEELGLFQTFEAILNQYHENKDPLSLSLRKEGRSFMQFFTGKMMHLKDVFQSTTDEKIRNGEMNQILLETVAKVEELKKILKNPLGLNLLEDPWLVEESVTWEKATLDEFIMLGSSYGGKSIQAVPHTFAKELLTLLDKFPKQLKNSTALIPAEIQQPIQDLIMPEEVKKWYIYSGFNQLIALSKENIEKKEALKAKELENFELSMMVDELVEMNEKGFQEYEERLDMIQKSHLLQIEEVDRMLNGARTRETNTTKVCNEKTMITEEILLKTRSELLRTFNALEQQRAENRNLWSQIQSCQNQINELRNQDSGCSIQ